MRERLQEELDKGVVLQANVPANDLAGAVAALGNPFGVRPTTREDIFGWEARVERILHAYPRTLSQFRYMPRTSVHENIARLVSMPGDGELKRRMEQKVANLDKIIRDL